jgi:hypothetical protein
VSDISYGREAMAAPVEGMKDSRDADSDNKDRGSDRD